MKVTHTKTMTFSPSGDVNHKITISFNSADPNNFTLTSPYAVKLNTEDLRKIVEDIEWEVRQMKGIKE